MPVSTLLTLLIKYFNLAKFRRRKPVRKKEKIFFRTNFQIRVQEVRLVGDNVEEGIYPTRTAQRMADDKGLDLVEIAPKAVPPVCRIIDYKKFLYEKKRKAKEIKAKTVKTVIKEIRFPSPNTDDHDFEFKAKHAERFLSEGAKVRAYVHFRGRSILFKERGELLLLKFVQRLEDFGTLENMPKLEGKRMYVFMQPKKEALKKKAKSIKDAKAKKGQSGKQKSGDAKNKELGNDAEQSDNAPINKVAETNDKPIQNEDVSGKETPKKD